MSLDIPPVEPLPPTASASATAPASPAAASESVDGPAPVKVDAIPATPPAEVHAAMGVAAQAHDRLAASGRGMHFKIDDASGKVIVEVHDANGNLLFTVPPSTALDVAGGGSLD